MIEITDLTCRHPDGTIAVNGVTLTIPDGQFLIICGPNGSGKTTLIRHINGLLKPAAGSIRVDGLDPAGPDNQIRRLVGMVFQDADSQIVGETVREDIAFGPENLGLEDAEIARRVADAMQHVGLLELAEKPCHLLSGGEKRRLAIAGALAMHPRFLILDEPFANLDFYGVRQTLEQIVGFHQQGHTVIVTTHDVEKVIAHADQLAILYRGELKALGPPASLLRELVKYAVRPPCYSLLGADPVSWLTA